MIKQYNRDFALEYARRWAFDRNPNFYNFDALGGDCTNFVSQCLYSGSLVMNFTPVLGWYYNSPNDRTPSWTGVKFLMNFLSSNKGLGPIAVQTDYHGVSVGDVIFLGNENSNFYHSLFISDVKNGKIFVASHTVDSFNRPLDDYFIRKIKFFHILGVNTPSG